MIRIKCCELILEKFHQIGNKMIQMVKNKFYEFAEYIKNKKTSDEQNDIIKLIFFDNKHIIKETIKNNNQYETNLNPNNKNEFKNLLENKKDSYQINDKNEFGNILENKKDLCEINEPITEKKSNINTEIKQKKSPKNKKMLTTINNNNKQNKKSKKQIPQQTDNKSTNKLKKNDNKSNDQSKNCNNKKIPDNDDNQETKLTEDQQKIIQYYMKYGNQIKCNTSIQNKKQLPPDDYELEIQETKEKETEQIKEKETQEIKKKETKKTKKKETDKIKEKEIGKIKEKQIEKIKKKEIGKIKEKEIEEEQIKKKAMQEKLNKIKIQNTNPSIADIIAVESSTISQSTETENDNNTNKLIQERIITNREETELQLLKRDVKEYVQYLIKTLKPTTKKQKIYTTGMSEAHILQIINETLDELIIQIAKGEQPSNNYIYDQCGQHINQFITKLNDLRRNIDKYVKIN
jgi:hypothetical protein